MSLARVFAVLLLACMAWVGCPQIVILPGFDSGHSTESSTNVEVQLRDGSVSSDKTRRESNTSDFLGSREFRPRDNDVNDVPVGCNAQQVFCETCTLTLQPKEHLAFAHHGVALIVKANKTSEWLDLTTCQRNPAPWNHDIASYLVRAEPGGKRIILGQVLSSAEGSTRFEMLDLETRQVVTSLLIPKELFPTAKAYPPVPSSMSGVLSLFSGGGAQTFHYGVFDFGQQALRLLPIPQGYSDYQTGIRQLPLAYSSLFLFPLVSKDSVDVLAWRSTQEREPILIPRKNRTPFQAMFASGNKVYFLEKELDPSLPNTIHVKQMGSEAGKSVNAGKCLSLLGEPGGSMVACLDGAKLLRFDLTADAKPMPPVPLPFEAALLARAPGVLFLMNSKARNEVIAVSYQQEPITVKKIGVPSLLQVRSDSNVGPHFSSEQTKYAIPGHGYRVIRGMSPDGKQVRLALLNTGTFALTMLQDALPVPAIRSAITEGFHFYQGLFVYWVIPSNESGERMYWFRIDTGALVHKSSSTRLIRPQGTWESNRKHHFHLYATQDPNDTPKHYVVHHRSLQAKLLPYPKGVTQASGVYVQHDHKHVLYHSSLNRQSTRHVRIFSIPK
jgi:hypothetical protein